MVDGTASAWKVNAFVLGHVAKGLLFCMIGGLGAYALFHGAQDPEGMANVLIRLHGQVFGKILVTLLGGGLLCHGVWRWMQAFKGHAHVNSKLALIALRVAHGVGGTFYALLAIFACSLPWVRSRPDAGTGTQEEVLRSTLFIPWGEWIVGLAGAIVILIGIMLMVRALKGGMTTAWEHARITRWKVKLYSIIGACGHLAWGLLNGIIGYFLIRVATTREPEEFRGIKGALAFLGGRTFGSLLLGAVSVGLVLFGIFLCAKARYQRTS